MTEWIEHDGKGVPDLPKGTEVYLRFRDGVGENWSPEEFDYWLPDSSDPRDYWTADGSHNDIVAYRVVSAPA